MPLPFPFAMVGRGAAGAALFSELTYRQSAISTDGPGAIDFTSQPLGTASSDRWIALFVAVAPGNNTDDVINFTAPTVGAVTLNLIIQNGVSAGTTGSGQSLMGFFVGNIPTGTSATITVDSGASLSQSFMRIAYYTFRSSASFDLTNSDNWAKGSFESGATIVDAEANSFVIIGSTSNNSPTTHNTDLTHSIGSSFTEDAELYAANGNNVPNNYALSSFLTSSALSSQSVTGTWSAGVTSSIYISPFEGYSG